ncbi:DUF4336 domain-containing protein [Aestuariibacter sp. AA17]|uniref:DUF4336 domain-containing protein n=1 Tax=Fluctibacter corallii TaxID=2984329 RepID=A0ABT3A3Y3_9ALTE|nr:DUF4336 domain-containing protein [Aestuariibacter sp. AA17]MCV2883398.1 DUF4336 domain-containing protein [Aestuariibacter sp. AA17]
MHNTQLNALGENIWIVEGKTVSFYSMPYTTRMTIVKLPDNKLWIHSPIALTPTLQQEVNALGFVAHLVAPNSLHHLFLAQWQSAFPDAVLWGTPEVIKKRNELCFTGELGSTAPTQWNSVLEQTLFSGSPIMAECVFFHKPSATLILTDLIENFSQHHFSGWQKWVAKIVGILAPNGKMPLDWRLSFLLNRREAKQHLSKIISWQPKQIVMAHGEIVTSDAMAFLNRSFDWLR